MPIPYKTRKVQGFTLVELVVAMTVAAILIVFALPNLRTFISNGRLITQTNDLISDLSFARSEAIKRRSNIGICRSTDGVTFAGAGTLGNGRVVFVDTDNNGGCDPGETILRFREPLAGANTLTTAAPLPIIFSANGSYSGIAGGVSFIVCDDRGPTKGKQINLNTTGQATVSAAAPGAC